MPKYVYLVEGECEKKFIDKFKLHPEQKFVSGKVEIFNVVFQKLTKAFLIRYPSDIHLIMVYDIDVDDDNILKENIDTLQNNGFKHIYHIQSIKNFEGEIILV